MNERPIYVTDTHSLLWYFYIPERLGKGAARAFEQIARNEADLVIPVIVIAEIIFVIEANRVPADVDDVIAKLNACPNIWIAPLSLERVLKIREISVIPEMHDRMIVSEALAHKATLITKDRTIIEAGIVPTVW